MLKQLMLILLSVSLYAEVKNGILDLSKDKNFIVVKKYKGVVGTHARTICARIKYQGDSDPHFFSYGGGGEKGEIIDLGLNKDSKEKVLRAEFGRVFLLGQQNLLPNKWYFISLVIDNTGNVKLFIDGKLDSTGTFPIRTGSRHDVRVGCDREVRRFWNGQLDDISIWKRAFDERQILKLMNTKVIRKGKNSLVDGFSSVNYSDLQLYFNFSENGEVLDKSNFKRHGSFVDKKTGQNKTAITKKAAVNCKATVSFSDGELEWIMQNELGIKEFRILNSKTGLAFQIVEAVGADLYSLEVPSGVVPKVVAVDAKGKIYKLINSNNK